MKVNPVSFTLAKRAARGFHAFWFCTILFLNLTASTDCNGQSITKVRPDPIAATDYRWFSLPIEVRGLPPHSEFIPVSCVVDFSALLQRLNVPGAVDERSFRLYDLRDGHGSEEVALQFSASDQPRPRVRHILPDTPPNVSYIGEYSAGDTPLEIKSVGELTWIARQPKGATNFYLLKFGISQKGKLIQVPYPPQNLRGFDEQGRSAPVRWFSKMQFHPQGPFEGVIHLHDGKELVTSYHIGPSAGAAAASNLTVRRPFFYPVNGPDGISLTEFGKPHDPTGSHAHHYSLWISHANVDGHDFWSERGGVIANDQLELMEDGPVFCRFVQKARWIDQGEEILRERRAVTVYEGAPNFRLMDIDLTFAPPGAKPVTFGKTSFGFLAARVAQSMSVFDGGGEIRNANGNLNEQRAHLKHSPWIDQSGPITPDLWGGISILEHPENPRSPTGWHCRNDGWAGAAFNMDGPFTLEPSTTLHLRYRIHLHRHNAVQAEVARRYDEYASKTVVQLGKIVSP